MSIFNSIDLDSHQQVSFFSDDISGLKAIIAIHNTNRGPALGGCRIWPYPDEKDAITDVLRLSRGMTYKAAMANLPFGGGKAVIIADSRTQKTPALLKAFGRCVDKLGGRYITAEDVGTSVEDMVLIKEVTTHVVGLPGGSGDPSPFTAIGVYDGICSAVLYRLGKNTLQDVKVAVQGLGHVGYYLCKLLSQAGAQLIVTDVETDLVDRAVQDFNAQFVPPESIYGAQVDVFAPCALGAIINDKTLPQFKCSVISGSANNQLESQAHGRMLAEKKILYAPDYVVNAGGLIDVYYEGPGYDLEVVRSHVSRIRDTLMDVFDKAKKLQICTNEAAERIAQERFQITGSV
jgi:leucine dehydrogenase